MSNPTLTLQKKELYLDESKSSITKYFWLWELENLKKTSARLTFLNGAGQSECWKVRFHSGGGELCFVFLRDRIAGADDLKPIIQLSILDREMNKVKTLSCEEYTITTLPGDLIYFTLRMELNVMLELILSLLLNHKIRVLIEFDVSVKYTTTLTQLPSDVIPGSKDGPLDTLQDVLSKYLDNDTFSDVVLEVKGVEIKAHKLLLSAQSLVFATMFEQTGMTEAMENRVKIDDIEPDVAKQMLEFIYTDKAPSKIGDFPIQLLAAAHKYQMKRLISKCEGILIEKISPENAVETFIVADMYELEILRKAVLEFIKRNTSLLKTTGFQDFKRDHSILACEIYREMMFAEEEKKN